MIAYINELPFEIIGSYDKYEYYFKRVANSRYTSLFDVYNSPSLNKKTIFNYWRDWFYELDFDNNVEEYIHDIRIIGYNAQTFTLGAVIIIHNIVCVLHITKEHNRLYVVDRNVAKLLQRRL